MVLLKQYKFLKTFKISDQGFISTIFFNITQDKILHFSLGMLQEVSV